MSGTIVERISGRAQMGKLVGVSSLQEMARWCRAHTTGCPLRKQSHLQIVPALARSQGQGSVFNTSPLLGAASDARLCRGGSCHSLHFGCEEDARGFLVATPV